MERFDNIDNMQLVFNSKRNIPSYEYIINEWYEWYEVIKMIHEGIKRKRCNSKEEAQELKSKLDKENNFHIEDITRDSD